MMKESDIHSLLKRAGNKLSAIDQIANQLFLQHHPLQPALQAYAKYLKSHRGAANATFNYAYYLSKDGQFEVAVRMYLRSLKLGIDSPEEVHLNIANIYMDHLRSASKARKHLNKALSLNNRYAGAYYNLGNLSEQEGKRAEAIRCFERCLQFDSGNESALARLADAHLFADTDDPLFRRLVSTAQKSNNGDIHFTLGRTYEKFAEYELAWQHFSRANMLDRSNWPVYNRASTEAVFQKIISQCDSSWLRRYQGSSDSSVFICGMFRTGSTLLEQVLAAHPRFTAGGEREFFPRLVAKEFRGFPSGLDSMVAAKALSWKQRYNEQTREIFGDAGRVTDKRPDNFLHIGLIKAILPSAKFVVTQRDWRDVATSVYSTRLGPKQNYATSLRDIHHYIGLQNSLVEHWQSLLGSELIRVPYEDLVTEPRKTITAVLAGLGEPWDERCLLFHQLKNAVQTASVWQVREPFHANSVGRWKNYLSQFESSLGIDLTP